MHDSRISTCSSTFEGELNLGLLYHWIGILMCTKANDLSRKHLECSWSSVIL